MPPGSLMAARIPAAVLPFTHGEGRKLFPICVMGA